MKIVNLGSLNLDQVYHVPHFVQPGETVSSVDYHCFAGGKGLNQSVAMAKAGAAVYHAGKTGSGSGLLMETLTEAGVDVSCVDVGGSITGHAIIQVNRDGENCILLSGGGNREISEEYVERILDLCGEEDMLVLQNEINGLDYILRRAGEKRLQVALNPAPMDGQLMQTDLSAVTWLILNEIEGEQISGHSDPDQILDSLLGRYPRMKVVLTLGEKGSVYRDSDLRLEQGIFPVPVKDTTAAGDTFSGYFLVAAAEGRPVAEGLERAAMASAIVVSRDGAACSIPYAGEVEEELLRQGKRQEGMGTYTDYKAKITERVEEEGNEG